MTASPELEFHLGERVLFAHSLERVSKPVSADRRIGRSRIRKEWERKRHYGEIRKGIVIGVRTLGDGEREWDGDGITFSTDHTFRAFIVVTDLRRRPLFVLPADLEADTQPMHPEASKRTAHE